MSETKEIIQSTSKSFISGFTELFQNKHFWITIFLVSSVFAGIYAFNKFFSKKSESSQPNQQMIQPQQTQQIIQPQQMIQQQPNQQMIQQQPQQMIQQEEMIQPVEESRQVAEQNLTQEELNYLKQQLNQSAN